MQRYSDSPWSTLMNLFIKTNSAKSAILLILHLRATVVVIFGVKCNIALFNILTFLSWSKSFIVLIEKLVVSLTWQFELNKSPRRRSFPCAIPNAILETWQNVCTFVFEYPSVYVSMYYFSFSANLQRLNVLSRKTSSEWHLHLLASILFEIALHSLKIEFLHTCLFLYVSEWCTRYSRKLHFLYVKNTLNAEVYIEDLIFMGTEECG